MLHPHMQSQSLRTWKGYILYSATVYRNNHHLDAGLYMKLLLL